MHQKPHHSQLIDKVLLEGIVLTNNQSIGRSEPEKTYKVGDYSIVHGEFDGDAQQVLSKFAAIVDAKKVTYQSLGGGYGTLKADHGGEVHITPYGLTLSQIALIVNPEG